MAGLSSILTLSAQPYTWQEALSYMLSLRSSFYFLLISRKKQSTTAERAWTMAWLGVHISAFILGFVAVFRRETFASVTLSDSPLTGLLWLGR